MSASVKGILQKINFIEADMELHKQILFSMHAEDKKEIKKVIDKIASQKNQINDLRLAIKKIDEDEYNKIIAIEAAAKIFQQISKDKKFVHVKTLNETGQCFITLDNGTKLDCLVAAKEDNGNWTVLTLEGETKEYPGGLVKEEQEEEKC